MLLKMKLTQISIPRGCLRVMICMAIIQGMMTVVGIRLSRTQNLLGQHMTVIFKMRYWLKAYSVCSQEFTLYFIVQSSEHLHM